MKIWETFAVVWMATLLGATPSAGESQLQVVDETDTNPAAAALSAVDTALAELLAVLADTDLSSEQRLASIDKIVRERFDMEVAARWALGTNRNRFSGPQATSYVCEFEPYLSNYIGSRFDRYQKEKVEILGARQSKSHVIVRTQILGGEYDLAVVEFRMRESGGQWRAVDVTFEGISVIKNLHAQFKEVLRAGGPERLVQLLSEKNGPRSNC